RTRSSRSTCSKSPWTSGAAQQSAPAGPRRTSSLRGRRREVAGEALRTTGHYAGGLTADESVGKAGEPPLLRRAGDRTKEAHRDAVAMEVSARTVRSAVVQMSSAVGGRAVRGPARPRQPREKEVAVAAGNHDRSRAHMGFAGATC